MSEEHRKLYTKKDTGTVPKVKQRNITNTSQRPPIQNERCSNVLSNNLGRDCNFITRQYRNPSRNPQYFAPMDSESSVRQNGIITSNGTSTPNTSATNSRRNSCGAVPKCDNVTKYPDKKQIEAKLGQIQEYLRITSSLMSNMKNTDEQLQNTIFIQSNEEEMDKNHLEQMVKDLLDSEAKLVVLLSEIDDEDNKIEKFPDNCDLEQAASGISKKELENKMEEATREMMMLKEQENFLLHSQLNVESQLREARMAQEKLMKGFSVTRNMNQEADGLMTALNGLTTDGFDAFSNSGASSKNYNENQTDMDRELEERLKTLNTKNQVSSAHPDQYQNQVDSLQNRILQMRDGNDNRNQLIQMLDNRDAQIQAEHNALQGKLMELQNKKMKVDQLVLQLQNMNEESDEDEMGSRVKMIVNMKDQLHKLKDMLNVVQNTEASFDTQNINDPDLEDQVWRMCSKSDNLIQNDVRSNSRHVENKSQGHSSNERHAKDKQVNKKSMNANEREHIFQTQSREKQKRELEVLMSKSATSNLNRDVNSESKSDVGASSNPLYEGSSNSWHPIPSNVYPMPQANDRYSSFSDDCPEDDMNEYADTPAVIQPMPSLIYPTSNYTKRRSEEPRIEVSQETGYLHATSDRSIRSPSIATPAYPRNRSRSNANTEAANKKQMQKQLELIRSVCDTMLDQSNESQPNIQVRNNLTPSPVYSEPRQYTSPSAHNMNALNVVHPVESHAFPTMPPFSPSDPGNYQNWLATNNMQTQAFMLNTLNQCCQMLWLQQRELSSLRNTVNMMQERNQNLPFDPNTQYPYLFPSGSGTNNLYNRSPSFQHPKLNPIGASMPNLNHAHCSQTNMDHACHANQCNVQNARILDSALNNNNSSAVHNQNTGAGGGGGGGEQPHGNNAVLHHPPPPPPTQIWNGQALNNQVAPGNRANNYWDNFRSYSRQNLLSTKNNEGLQNASTLFGDRSNTSLQGLSLALSQPTQKQNTESQESVPGASVSLENTPGRFRANVSRQRSNSSVGVASAVPPDVLNVNQKTNDFPLDFGNTGFSTLSNMYGNTSFESHDTFKDSVPTNRRNRNEWHDDARSPNDSPKSKLFEELRENVYKEVASLISANQGRPHFLIQLFRDLQLISSDPLRRRTLQSIQTVISNSINSPGSSTGATRQVQIPTIETENLEIENQPAGEFFDLGNFIWPKSLINQEAVETNSPEHLAEVLSFLNNHNEDIFSDSLVRALRDTLVESTFSAIFVNTNTKDGIIQKHFASLLTEALEHYRGKKVQDVRLNVLQTVEDLLRGEISLIRLMRENISEGGDSIEQCLPMNSYDMQLPLNEETGPQMQNGDLAEADQSRIEIEEDEGAVGGVLNIALERSTSSIAGQVLPEDNDTPKLDLVMTTESDVEFVEQGLDQVPTRLTTHSNSRSNTPSKDKKNSGLDGPEHF